MINDDFYPTPPEVVDRMIAPIIAAEGHRYSLMARILLEPSAGKGDILDHLVRNYRVHQQNVYACELELDLRIILAGKGYQVVEMDFLQYKEHYPVSLIVMNPPFSAGV